MMADVFVSYSHKDEAIVDRLVAKLKSIGYSVWLDREDIVGGKSYREEIAQAIEDAEVFLLILSRDSMSAPFVVQELNTAADAKKQIIPIMLDKFEDEDILAALRVPIAGIHRIDLSNFESGLLAVQRTLREFVPRPLSPPEEPVASEQLNSREESDQPDRKKGLFLGMTLGGIVGIVLMLIGISKKVLPSDNISDYFILASCCWGAGSIWGYMTGATRKAFFTIALTMTLSLSIGIYLSIKDNPGKSAPYHEGAFWGWIIGSLLSTAISLTSEQSKKPASNVVNSSIHANRSPNLPNNAHTVLEHAGYQNSTANKAHTDTSDMAKAPLTSKLERLKSDLEIATERRERLRALLKELQMQRDVETRLEEQARLDYVIEKKEADVRNANMQLEELEGEIRELRTESGSNNSSAD